MKKRSRRTEETTRVSVDEDPHAFHFDLDEAIRDQVVKKLNASPECSLSKNVGPKESGIYVLYFGGELVYVGKASKETTVGTRRSIRREE